MSGEYEVCLAIVVMILDLHDPFVAFTHLYLLFL
jgi:hypothetical protein